MSNLSMNRAVGKPADPKNEISEIRRLNALLDYLGLLNDYIPPDEGTPFEQLYLTFLNRDHTPSKFLVIIAFLNQINQTGEIDNDNVIHQLQFFVPVGIEVEVEEDKIIHVMGLITRFNNLLPIGLFGLTPDNKVYFRHILLSKERRINNHVFVEVVEMIEFYLKVFGSNIMEFIEGRKGFEQALDDGINGLMNVVNKN
jgi:hypothetical protein